MSLRLHAPHGWALAGLFLACGARTELHPPGDERRVRVADDEPAATVSAAGPIPVRTDPVSVAAVHLELVVDASANARRDDLHEAVWPEIERVVRAFVASRSHNGTSASLTLFPRLTQDASASSCEPADYVETDVPSQPLPTEDFDSALRAAGQQAWPDATSPEPNAVRGVLQRVGDAPDTTVVLVSAGLFGGCGEMHVEVPEPITNIPIFAVGVGDWTADSARAPWGIARWSGAIDHSTHNAKLAPSELRFALEHFWLMSAGCHVNLPSDVDETCAPHLQLDGTSESLSFIYDTTCKDPLAWRFVAAEPNSEPSTAQLCAEACESAARLFAEGEADFSLRRQCPIGGVSQR